MSFHDKKKFIIIFLFPSFFHFFITRLYSKKSIINPTEDRGNCEKFFCKKFPVNQNNKVWSFIISKAFLSKAFIQKIISILCILVREKLLSEAHEFMMIYIYLSKLFLFSSFISIRTKFKLVIYLGPGCTNVGSRLLCLQNVLNKLTVSHELWHLFYFIICIYHLYIFGYFLVYRKHIQMTRSTNSCYFIIKSIISTQPLLNLQHSKI